MWGETLQIKLKGKHQILGKISSVYVTSEKLVSLLYRAFFQNYKENLMTAQTKYELPVIKEEIKITNTGVPVVAQWK